MYRQNNFSLQYSIDSFFTQNYPYKEIIIIDGGSNDGTVELLKINDQKIDSWGSESDRGIYQIIYLVVSLALFKEIGVYAFLVETLASYL